MIRWLVIVACLALLPASLILAAPAQRDRIADLKQFSELSRIANGGRHASFPQVMFVIDRDRPHTPKLYFVNSKSYAYHIDFIQQTYLSVQSVDALVEASYAEPNRRFILGSIVHYPNLRRFGVEFWEGDQLTRPIIEQTMALLGVRFPFPLAFKPNSQPQIDLAATMPGLPIIETNDIYGSRSELVLNNGYAVGRLRILPRLTDDTILRRNEILILDEVPISLTPVSGLITTQFSTPLSHVNLLAKSWRIPNGYRQNAAREFSALVGKMVTYRATDAGISLRLATPREIASAERSVAQTRVQIAPADLIWRGLPSLAEMRARDSVRVGAKAANLGEIVSKLRPDVHGFRVPPGFSIPFAYYVDFVRGTGLAQRIDRLLADPDLRDNAPLRRRALADLRAAFAAAPLDPTFLVQVAARRDAVIGPHGVFVRSSTNSEDLPGFNGAGLYSSVPNVTTDVALAAAIKTVWGSIWNDAAFEAREAAGIDHRSVVASAFIQLGMNADAAGVIITENPFDPAEFGAMFINAKRGLGIRVVEGRKVAEQLIYRANPESIQVLTRSTDDTMLIFDASGGVRESPAEPGRLVLTDARARRLASAAARVQSMFGGKPQDIEWLMIGEQIYVVQSRPYLRGN